MTALVAHAEEGWTLHTGNAAFSPRDSMGEVVYDGKIWLMGGFAPQRQNDVWSSPDGANWTQATPSAPWASRNVPGTVVYDGKMWVVAGYSQDDPIPWHNGNRNDVWFSEDGVTWEQLTDIPWGPRHESSVVTFDNELWVIGGFANGPLVNESWSYNVIPEPGAFGLLGLTGVMLLRWSRR